MAQQSPPNAPLPRVGLNRAGRPLDEKECVQIPKKDLTEADIGNAARADLCDSSGYSSTLGRLLSREAKNFSYAISRRIGPFKTGISPSAAPSISRSSYLTARSNGPSVRYASEKTASLRTNMRRFELRGGHEVAQPEAHEPCCQSRDVGPKIDP